MSSVSELAPTPVEQEDRAEFGQLRTFTWRSFSTSSTRAWAGLYLAAFFGTLVANYGISLFQASEPVTVSEALTLFMKDRELFWKMRPDMDVIYSRNRIRTNRYGFRGDDPVPGRRVVLCLGDSMPFGWGVGQTETFPVQLQARLNAAAKSGKLWEVINAGVPSYSSFQTRLIAERLVLRWKPEVVVVSTGGNDILPVDQSDRQAYADRTTSFLGVFPDERGIALRDAKAGVPRCTREELAANLREIARITRAAGARLVILGTPVNLQAMSIALNPDDPETTRWRAFFESTMQMLHAHGLKKALEKTEAALAENPGDCCFLWMEGILLLKQHNVDAAKELLEQAIEHYPFPRMSKRSYRQVEAEVAREERAPFIDVADLLFHRAVASPSQNWFADNCHPSALGNAILADLLFETITGQKPPAPATIEGQNGRVGKESPPVSPTLPGPQLPPAP
jgi:lysophospholipase L1-like esterase